MRSLLYNVRSRSFLFDITKLGVVDGLRLGDKVRFAMSSVEGYSRVFGRRATSTPIAGTSLRICLKEVETLTVCLMVLA